MKTEEFKKILKPIIKECIQETLIESKLISGIIVEVMKGMNVNQTNIQEQNNKFKQKQEEQNYKRDLEERRKKLESTRKSLLEAVNKNAYGGVDIFENVTPMAESKAPSAGSPLSDVDPGDPGVDISGIFNLGGKKWSKLI